MLLQLALRMFVLVIGEEVVMVWLRAVHVLGLAELIVYPV